jgi:hypothetical protein
MREALRAFVLACRKAPNQLTMEQHQAMNRASQLLTGIDAMEAFEASAPDMRKSNERWK